jgi:hypothetical protein
MKYLSLILILLVLSLQLAAKENLPSETLTFSFEELGITNEPYRDSWAERKSPFLLPGGTRIEKEKLIVSFKEVVVKSEEDRLRSRRSWSDETSLSNLVEPEDLYEQDENTEIPE